MSLENLIVKNYMIKIGNFPVVKSNQILKEAVDLMDEYKLGIVSIVDNNFKLLGVITDGDLRRAILRSQKPLSAILVDDVIDYSVQNPLIISDDDLLIESIKLMNKKQIWDLPVLNVNKKLIGLLHLHTAIKNYLESK
tara:strand:- start:60 stop:473 length:414 start_codon:yes stop_codon:yes gene_type:complete